MVSFSDYYIIPSKKESLKSHAATLYVNFKYVHIFYLPGFNVGSGPGMT
jgi:hypothetical protein